MDLVTQHTTTPVGGPLALFKDNWKEVTEDPWVLEMVVGNGIECLTTPTQGHPPRGLVLDSAIMSKEMLFANKNKFCVAIAKNAVAKAPEGTSGFTSTLFLVPKANGTWRPVLNLKPLNCFVVAPRLRWSRQGL